MLEMQHTCQSAKHTKAVGNSTTVLPLFWDRVPSVSVHTADPYCSIPTLSHLSIAAILQYRFGSSSNVQIVSNSSIRAGP